MHQSSMALIISDVHLGYEDSMATQGVFLPRLQLKKAESIIDEGVRAGAKRLLIDGDLKHVFEKLTKGERLEVTELIRHALEADIKEIVLVRGNHDTFVAPLLKDFGVEVVDDYMDLGDGIIVTHGHKLVDAVKSSSTVIIGHEHPSLEISLAGAKVKLQALLKSPLKGGGELLVLPAISLYQTGTAITPSPETYLSPIVKELAELQEAVPIIVDREIGVVELPTLKELFAGII
ncbi:metallophosphoesterase [Acidilobus saccharovorans]|nr:metallophosphoesterase [Acidilobus saccharovorans]